MTRKKQVLIVLLALLPLGAWGLEAKPQTVISIIIDDIGYRADDGREMINLPAKLTFAVLPNAPKAKELANFAQRMGKEVMLHMPMQSTLGEAPEQGVLDVDMSEKEVVAALQKAFDRVPHAVGMNNHQGSMLTRHPGHMAWVMKEIAKHDYFFVDSRTSSQSVAEDIAREQGVPVVRRDVFLDHQVDVVSIKAEFMRLISIAQKRGHAVGIGHPHPETLAVLREMLPTLKELNIEVVPISQQWHLKTQLVSNHQNVTFKPQN